MHAVDFRYQQVKPLLKEAFSAVFMLLNPFTNSLGLQRFQDFTDEVKFSFNNNTLAVFNHCCILQMLSS